MKLRVRIIVLPIACLVVVLTTPAPAQEPSIAQTVGSLREIKTSDADPLPAAAIPLLRRLKHQLRDLVSAKLNAQNEGQPTPAQSEAGIQAALKKIGVAVEEPKEVVVDEKYEDRDYVYGDIYGVEIRRPAGHHDLLAATITVGVCCGEDTSLYLFRKQGRAWKLILADESDGYTEVSGAQGRFRYVISAPDRRGDFFVVTANVNPWCTSNWQGLRYKVSRPGPQPDRPEVILRGEKIIYLGVDDPVYELNLAAHTFTLKFMTEATRRELSEGQTSHRLILKYLVAGNRVKRVAKKTRAGRL
ncbi:MAG TPA: hypothetical protein VFD58_18275 [Blastocatellia bacterium]|nr:hypothetical protein [Blastocatellia bacterium]